MQFAVLGFCTDMVLTASTQHCYLVRSSVHSEVLLCACVWSWGTRQHVGELISGKLNLVMYVSCKSIEE